MTPEASPPALLIYRFAGVEVDAERVLLRVDGRPCPVAPKALQLLLALCRASGTPLSRSELIEALWPGGQVISDEALTQLVFRLRAALGPHAAHIRTVRGVGLCLDADVSTHPGNFYPVTPSAGTAVAEPPDDAAAADPSLHAATPPTLEERAHVRVGAIGHRRDPLAWPSFGWPLLLVTLMLVAAASWWLWSSPAMWIDEGYGLTADDLYAELPETAAMVADALLNDARGERARSRSLLEALHRSDSSTPIPAALVALWAAAAGDRASASEWLSAARIRAEPLRDMFVNIFLEYIAAEVEGDAERVIFTAGALLDVRPEAWRMHHARAHLMEFRGMREGALREISQIKVVAFGDRKRDLVIADRASMGDVEGAQGMIDDISPGADPAMHAFISGRIAWSRGAFEAAHEKFLEAAGHAYEVARIDIYRRSLIYAGALEAALGRDAEAVTTLERARSAIEGRAVVDEVDLALLLAHLHAEAGRVEAMNRELDRAVTAAPEVGMGNMAVAAQLAASRLRKQTPVALPGSVGPDSGALLRAMAAWVAGRIPEARTALAEARHHGVAAGRLVDEMRWLELQLEQPVSPEAVIDPPYPPLSRVMLRRQIRGTLAARGEDPGQARP